MYTINANDMVLISQAALEYLRKCGCEKHEEFHLFLNTVENLRDWLWKTDWDNDAELTISEKD